MFSVDIFPITEGGKGGWSYIEHGNSFITYFPSYLQQQRWCDVYE
jgi:hypothetical protein